MKHETNSQWCFYNMLLPRLSIKQSVVFVVFYYSYRRVMTVDSQPLKTRGFPDVFARENPHQLLSHRRSSGARQRPGKPGSAGQFCAAGPRGGPGSPPPPPLTPPTPRPVPFSPPCPAGAAVGSDAARRRSRSSQHLSRLRPLPSCTCSRPHCRPPQLPHRPRSQLLPRQDGSVLG